jgi:hypothetical protein
MKSKFGIIALLDALGARTLSLANAKAYLRAAETLHKRLKSSILNAANLNMPFGSDPEANVADFIAKTKRRFFGDCVLLSCETTTEPDVMNQLHRMALVLSAFVAEALAEGILYRGAVAIGNYIERANVVLGPAVADAANWYERPDCVVVCLTPTASNHVKYFVQDPNDLTKIDEVPLGGSLVWYELPVSGGDTFETYVVNWPDGIVQCYAKVENTQPMTWYFQKIRDLTIPIGFESKYTNTECFVRHCVQATVNRQR